MLNDKVLFFLYSLYFILKPFYFWSSGLPQVADIIIVLLFISLILKNKLTIQLSLNYKKFLIVLSTFVFYVALVNIIWMIILNGSSSFLTTTMFYLFNFFAVITILLLNVEYGDLIFDITYMAVISSLLIQMFIYLIGGGYTGGRQTAGFNNPNQLGYFSLLSLSLLLFTSQYRKTKPSWLIIGIAMSAILCFSSLSKAAIISFTGMLGFYIFSKSKDKDLKRKVVTVIIISSIVFIFLYYYTDIIKTNALYLSVERRINSIGLDSDDNLVGRGYDRIFKHPEYLLFGAGEGEYSRFNNYNMEFHSTLGNILVSYGLIGLSLFISIIIISIKNDGFYTWYIIFFILIYGLTHNGVRNSMFWMLLALYSCNIKKFER